MRLQKAVINFEDQNDVERNLVVVGRYYPPERETRETPSEPEDFEITETYALDGEPIAKEIFDALLDKHFDDIRSQVREDYYFQNPKAWFER